MCEYNIQVLGAYEDTSQIHLHNVLLSAYQTFGDNTPHRRQCQSYADQLGHDLPVCPKPIPTRWLSDYDTATWIQQYTPTILSLHQHLLSSSPSFIKPQLSQFIIMYNNLIHAHHICYLAVGSLISYYHNWCMGHSTFLNYEATLTPLSAGQRGHEMPMKILEWKQQISQYQNNIDSLLAPHIGAGVSNETKQYLASSQIKQGVIGWLDGIIDSMEKWFGCWLKLPLVVCAMASTTGSSLLLAYLLAFMHTFSPSQQQPIHHRLSSHINHHHNNNNHLAGSFHHYITLYQIMLQHSTLINNYDMETLGFHQLLLNPSSPMLDEVISHINSDPHTNSYILPHRTPTLYQYAISHCYLIIHQQQCEGIFNKFDLHCHPNQSHKSRILTLLHHEQDHLPHIYKPSTTQQFKQYQHSS
jgi:hypothetical protein